MLNLVAAAVHVLIDYFIRIQVISFYYCKYFGERTLNYLIAGRT